jgi:isochorismate synthase EntC
VCAGVGVVPDSDPDAELAETSAKFEALLTALVRP